MSLMLDIHGREDLDGRVRYIGHAALQPDGSWRALADIDGALCVVEVNIRCDALAALAEALFGWLSWANHH
jgi:hypothetical protein